MNINNTTILEKIKSKWDNTVDLPLDKKWISILIDDFFNKISLKAPNIIFCDSPLEVHTLTKLLRTKYKLNQRIAVIIGEHYYEYVNDLINKISIYYNPEEFSHLVKFFNLEKSDLLSNSIDNFFDEENFEIENLHERLGLTTLEFRQKGQSKLLELINIKTDLEFRGTDIFNGNGLELNFNFSELADPIFNRNAAFVDYFLETVPHASINSDLITRLRRFIQYQSLGIFKSIIIQNDDDQEIYWLISKGPSDVLYNTKEKKIIHNDKSHAVKFSDNWGIYLINGTNLTEYQFEQFILNHLDEDELNRMDYAYEHKNIISALRYHYNYSIPKRYEYWKWYTPEDELWPNEDQTLETDKAARLAYERKKIILALRKSQETNNTV